MMFEPKEEETWPEGLEVRECLSRIQAGSSSRIFVPVHNQTQRGITLRKRTELGMIQLVQSVTPLPVEHTEEATMVRVFLCPCVGPFPSVGLTLTWFIWD